MMKEIMPDLRSKVGPRIGKLRLLAFTPEEFELRRKEWPKKSRVALPRIAKAYTVIAIGCAIMAAGYSFFMIPQKIAPGGVYGIATVFHYASDTLFGRAIPTGSLALVMNIPLFFWGLRSIFTKIKHLMF